MNLLIEAPDEQVDELLLVQDADVEQQKEADEVEGVEVVEVPEDTEPEPVVEEKPKARPKSAPPIRAGQVKALRELFAKKFDLQLADVWTIIETNEGERVINTCDASVASYLEDKYGSSSVLDISQEEAGDLITVLQK